MTNALIDGSDSAPVDGGDSRVIVSHNNPFEINITSSASTYDTPGRARSDYSQSISPASAHSPRSPTVLTSVSNHSAASTPIQPVVAAPVYNQSPARTSTVVPPDLFDDDETTQPSSTGNTTDPSTIASRENNYRGRNENSGSSNSLARFFENTRRRLGSKGGDAGMNDEDDDFLEGALISGSLQKLGRNGKWQMRWFETDGECLSYYKSQKRSKVLATLDLEKVGDIKIQDSDASGCSFVIQVLGREYLLRADTKAQCKDWVITLNRIKEARLNQGNVKLIDPYSSGLYDPVDDPVAPRLVVVANRERTRAVAESQDFDQMMNNDPAHPTNTYPHGRHRNTFGNVALARWTKQTSSLTRLGAKLSKWARSIARYKCTDVEDVAVDLDRHVHPPGHDDKPSRRRISQYSDGENKDSSNWIGKEISHGSTPNSTKSLNPANAPAANKPSAPVRSVSKSSDDEARYIS